ncbi:hypothetical protein [Candidatus Deianiraea vastatrix]|uniref:Uncharacterized protein n=1 Tax=Candidatus Deianiraea vastatrix TaxID=2163644 RepID=A0A5B8XDY6_9RICK|nr:hypothetical protein [Candidatus Deianiraea vastatrix]QED23473.1 hypothetical protein Deia_00681 [Candidatus Deianiraea vastatrix]
MEQQNKTKSIGQFVNDTDSVIEDFEIEIDKADIMSKDTTLSKAEREKAENKKNILTNYLENIKIQKDCFNKMDPSQELTHEIGRKVVEETVARIEEKYLIRDSQNIAENMTQDLPKHVTKNEQINEINNVKSGIQNYYYNTQKDINKAERYKSEKTQELQEVQETIKSIEAELQILQNEKHSVQKESLWQQLINFLTGQQSKAEQLQEQIEDVHNYLEEKKGQQSFILEKLNEEIANNPENVLQKDGIHQAVDQFHYEYDQQERGNQQPQFRGSFDNDDTLMESNGFDEEIDEEQYDDKRSKFHISTQGSLYEEKSIYNPEGNSYVDKDKSAILDGLKHPKSTISINSSSFNHSRY